MTHDAGVWFRDVSYSRYHSQKLTTNLDTNREWLTAPQAETRGEKLGRQSAELEVRTSRCRGAGPRSIYIHKGRVSIRDWPIAPLIISETSRTPIGRSRERRTESGARPSRVVRPGHVR